MEGLSAITLGTSVLYLAMLLVCAWTAASAAAPEKPQGRTPRPAKAAVEAYATAPAEASTSTIENLYATLPAEYEGTLETLPMVGEFFPEGKENKSDPAYKTYKDGYSDILDERWEDARKKFAEVLSKYPKSEYTDDASYWSAYALKYIDRKKAIKAYKEFIAKYPNSSYFDDAVADLSELSNKHRMPAISSWSTSSSSSSYSDDDSTGDGATTYYRDKGGKGYGYGYGYATAPAARASMDRLRRSLRSMTLITPRPGLAHIAGVPRALRMPRMPRTGSTPFVYNNSLFDNDDTLDEKTRIKMDALSALGDTKEDSVSYKTLRDVAIDPTQPRELRMTALQSLSDFKKFDVLPDFISIASNDKDDEIQSTAINYISDIGGSKDKDRRVDALIKLYGMLPTEKKDQRETIFYTIADIGNDKAVDFLISVARNNKDYEMRSQAIYYLGNIGGEKARAALYEILKTN